MRRLVVAELALLAAAFAVGLLLAAALLLQCCLGRRSTLSNKRPSSELPLSRPTDKQQSRLLLLLIMLCSGRRRRRARVEPATANSAEASPAAAEAEDVARWRERWFGPASRALYTIDEVDEECPTEDGETRDDEKPEPETPFYTPPASPAACLAV